MFEKCTNTSSPSGREMTPKPFSALKNFTVPVGMVILLVARGPGNRTEAVRNDHNRARETREPRATMATADGSGGTSASDAKYDGHHRSRQHFTPRRDPPMTGMYAGAAL